MPRPACGAWRSPLPGNANELVLGFPSGGDVSVGDSIVTAGTGPSVFPPDIPIGRVTSIDRTTQTITLAPYANVRQLEDVQVLTHPKAHGSATAAAAHRAHSAATGAAAATQGGGRAMRLPWRRGRVRAARRQAAHMPAHLSFRGRRERAASTRVR